MSKKHNESRPAPSNAQPPGGTAGSESGGRLAPQEPSMKKHLAVFWSVVAVAVAAARVLEYIMPQTPEYVIERWIMLAFGAFLAAFIFYLK